MLRPDEYNDDRIVMHHLGLGPKSNDVDFPMAMLQDIMTMLNHTYVDVLKVDIEGGEHIWIEKENPQVLGRVGQLLIEMHLFIGKTGISEEELMKSVKILEQSPQPSMRIFHKELNIPILPASCEISFIQPYWIDWNLKKHLWDSFDYLEDF